MSYATGRLWVVMCETDRHPAWPVTIPMPEDEARLQITWHRESAAKSPSLKGFRYHLAKIVYERVEG